MLDTCRVLCTAATTPEATTPPPPPHFPARKADDKNNKKRGLQHQTYQSEDRLVRPLLAISTSTITATTSPHDPLLCSFAVSPLSYQAEQRHRFNARLRTPVGSTVGTTTLAVFPPRLCLLVFVSLCGSWRASICVHPVLWAQG